MAYCIICGQKLPEEANFCFRCGKNIPKTLLHNKIFPSSQDGPIIAANPAGVVAKLNEYFNELHGNRESILEKMRNAGFSGDDESNKFIFENPNAFLFGVIFDQMIRAEKAWGAPYKLYQRLGNRLDLERIVGMDRKTLSDILRQKPALHRFCNKLAGWLIEAAGILLKKYGGEAKNIWTGDNLEAEEVIGRLLEFPGISQKKANMAASILVRIFQVPLTGLQMIDVAFDRHIRRVFLRTGLAENDTMDSVIAAGRKYSPQYPGKLDMPAWYAGRNWCHPKHPVCDDCKLQSCCLRLTHKGVNIE